MSSEVSWPIAGALGGGGSTAASHDVVYLVDGEDRIVFVNDAWDRFALANAGESITSSHVLQSLLWDYMTDSTTRELYRQVMKRTRKGGAVRFSFRCDSPSCRRLLAMQVSRGEGGTLEFRTRTLREEDRQLAPLPAAKAARSGEWVRVCSWCKRLFVGESWEELEAAIERLRLFECAFAPSMTHGICEQCHQAMVEALHSSP
jgi:hypothetical protein